MIIQRDDMKVYAVFSSYFDGGSQWETVLALYRFESDANTERDKLELTDSGHGQTYYVQEMKVL